MSDQDSEYPIVVAITGASGAVYATRLLEVLLRGNIETHLTISTSGAQVILQELGRNIDLKNFRVDDLLPGLLPSLLPNPESAASLVYHDQHDFMTPIASGSFRTRGMVVVPCSGSTLAGIALGTSNNLIQRAADVHLKERRKLIVVPREAPLSLVHIDNMKRITEAGAVVLPASPGWYHGVSSLNDIVDFIVARILDQLGLDNSLISRWGDGSDES